MTKIGILGMLILGVLLSACGGEKEKLAQKTQQKMRQELKEEFIQKLQDLIIAPTAEQDYPMVMQVESGNCDEVEALLKQGARHSAVNRFGLPVLFIAARAGHTEIVELLINAGADVNASVKTFYDTDGGCSGTADGTAMGYAAGAGKVEIMELLLNAGADIDGSGPGGDTPLIHAAHTAQAESVEWLLDNSSSAGQDKALKIIRRFLNQEENYIKTRKLLAGESYP